MGSVYARSNFRRCLSQYPSARLGGRELTMAAAQNGGLESPAIRDNRPLAWLPRHSVTRRTAKITREVQCLWNAKLGSAATVVPVDKIEPLFNDLQIFPTRAQIDEMLRCAQRSAGRNSTKYLTFAEFCIFATGLKHSLQNKRLDPNFFRRLLQKDGRDKLKTRRMSSIPHPEVFLGGSCNPTTWRQDEAIPILKNSGVTFFNPQVSDWSPELIELEHEAKENAQILLYVLDSQTRNVVSLVETAYFLGKKRKIIIVMNLFQEAGHEIASEKITCNEFNDLNSSSCLLKQLMERQKVAVFSNVREALRYANEVLKERSNETDEKTKMKEAFESLDVEKCGQISPNDVSEAIRLFMQKRNQSDELQKNILQKIDNFNQVNNKTGKVDFQQFCQIVSNLNLNCDVNKYSNGHVQKRISFTPDLFRSLSTPDDSPTFAAKNGLNICDIYLGGDCDHHENWRQKIAIPGIKNACLTFYNPENERQINKKLSPSEFAAINNAHVKLFVITSTSRSLFPMVLASYFIGIGANVVLCIQYLPDKCVIGSDELSHTAVKDYNRGRHYLADIARRENVPIFESISDAVQTAINKCIR